MDTSRGGPSGHWLLGHLPHFRRDALGFITDCARRYGDFVPFRMGWSRHVLLSHPDLVEEVLVTKNRHFRKPTSMRVARPVLGDGLLTSEGEFWRRQRRLAQPAFHHDRVAAYASVMVAAAERMLAGWADGQTRDLKDEMQRLTLRIVAKCLFDADLDGDATGVGPALEVLVRAFNDRSTWPVRLPLYFPTPANLRLWRAARRLDRVVLDIIARRRASGADRGDFLSTLLKARAEDDGARMTDRQVRDEVMTLLLAGHETAANTLSWAWYLLSRHPEAEAELHAELDRVLGGRAPSFDDLPRLRYAGWVVAEVLRLYPTAWAIGRESVEHCSVGGRPVHAGTTVWMCQWVLHRDGRFFDDAESFRPGRWADGLAERLPKYAYFPFGGGPRVCIGAGFARMEAVLLLTTIAGRFRLTLAPGATVRPLPTITLRPDSSVPVRLSARARSRSGGQLVS